MAQLVNLQITTNSARLDKTLMQLSVALMPQSLGVFLGKKVDPYFRMRAHNRFANEGDDVVGKWSPLADSTVHIRQNAGYGGAHPINRRTGELESFIVDSPNAILVDGAGATLRLPGNAPSGSILEKMRTAQGGKDDPPTDPRPVIGMNNADMAWVLTSLANDLRRVLR